MYENRSPIRSLAPSNSIPMNRLSSSIPSDPKQSSEAQEGVTRPEEYDDITTQSDTPKQFHHRTKSTVNITIWLPEIASFLFALLALVAIVILLAARKDKPLPNWPSVLNINSLVAIFSSISKAALLLSISGCIGELKWIWFAKPQRVSDFDRFDSASKGPWGALLLLFKRPGNICASLGAFITILTLAIDPFAQQVLQFNNCLRPIKESSATIVRTNNYSVGAFAYGDGHAFLDAKMTATLYQGLLNPPPNTSALVSTYCQTGNCTFPNARGTAYTSLAMCSSVEDISHTISEKDPVRVSSSYETWNLKLPSGLQLLEMGALATAGVNPFSEDSDHPLLTLEALMVNTNCSVFSSGDCPVKPWAIRATLSPCLHIYANVSYNNSIFKESISSTTMLPYVYGFSFYALAGDYPSLPSIDCSPSESRQGTKTQATSRLAGGQRYANYLDQPNDPDTLWYDPSCTYVFGYGASSALRNSLLSTFFGSVDAPNNISVPPGLFDTKLGDAWLLSLYADGQANLSSVVMYMEGLATSITATIREGGDVSNSAPALGTVLKNQTCVGVKWAWLGLPVALVILTLVFLVATVIQSGRYTRVGAAGAGRKPWKSSSLPLLWCGMSDETRAKYERFDEVKKMEESGDHVKAALRRQWWDEYEEPGADGFGQGRWALREESVFDR